MVVKSKIYNTNFIIYVNLNGKEYEVNNCSLYVKDWEKLPAWEREDLESEGDND